MGNDVVVSKTDESTVCWKNLNDLNDHVFFIPSYQRGLRWKKKQLKKLFEDCLEFQEDKNKSRNMYSLQALTVKKIDRSEECCVENEWLSNAISNNEYPIYEVIDGQQRLTTIWLLQRLKRFFIGNLMINMGSESHLICNYSLVFEGKNAYNSLIYKISKEIGNDDKQGTCDELKTVIENIKNELITELGVKALKDVDCQYLLNLIELFYEQNDKINPYKLAKLFSDKNDKFYRFIWQELGVNNSTEETIEKFTKINANKVKLTQAELIKAIIFKGIPQGDRIEMFAAQWEDIERSLNDDKFWSFFVSSKKIDSYETRIDYLFEIYFHVKNNNSNKDEKNITVDEFISNYIKDEFIKIDNEYNDKQRNFSMNQDLNNDLENNRSKAKHEVVIDLWKDIMQIHEALRDWYSNFETFHSIGLLTELEKNQSSDLIKDLYQEYINSNKQEFERKIIKKIRNNKYVLRLIKDVSTGGNKSSKVKKQTDSNKSNSSDNKVEVTWDDKTTLDDLDLSKIAKIDSRTEKTDEDSDGESLKPILLIFNVALVVLAYRKNGNRETIRFPFEYFKKNITSIEEEHINSASFEYKDDDKYNKLSDQDKVEVMISVISMLDLDVEKKKKYFDLIFNDANNKYTTNANPEAIDVNSSADNVKGIRIKDDDLFKRKLRQLYKDVPLDNICNLTLIDKTINSSFKVANFIEKRNCVLAAQYGYPKPSDPTDTYKALILPGTEFVFMRMFKKTTRLDALRWTSEDSELYSQQIKESIFEYLK